MYELFKFLYFYKRLSKSQWTGENIQAVKNKITKTNIFTSKKNTSMEMNIPAIKTTLTM